MDTRSPSAPPLKKIALGETAPDFSLLNHRGQVVNLSAITPKSMTILWFYRGAPFWCHDWNNLKKFYEQFQAKTPELMTKPFQLLVIHPGDWEKNKEICHQDSGAFSILYDAYGKTAKKYGAVLIPGFLNRNRTIWINEYGEITQIHSGKPKWNQLTSS
ncbi:MAG: redoxin domain-containing protein [Cyanobacteria bacterium]|nr:redoxin domain-containing protein [Cyanobacteriota bacterium]